MKSFAQEYRNDEARIAERAGQEKEALGSLAFQAGAYKACAHYYAMMADGVQAQHVRMTQNPTLLLHGFISKPGGPSCDDIHQLLNGIHEYLRCHPELYDIRYYVEQAAAEAKAAAERERLRADEDLDAPAAAKSDDDYDARIDAGLIGRSDFLPAAQS